jgi:hypothetical protein
VLCAVVPVRSVAVLVGFHDAISTGTRQLAERAARESGILDQRRFFLHRIDDAAVLTDIAN